MVSLPRRPERDRGCKVLLHARLEVRVMAKAQKTVSIRLEADDYKFLRSLAEAGKEDLSTAVRDLVARGRVLLALERYRDGKASLSKVAEVAGLSISEMMDVLGEHGIASDLRVEDYRESLNTLREIW